MELTREDYSVLFSLIDEELYHDMHRTYRDHLHQLRAKLRDAFMAKYGDGSVGKVGQAKPAVLVRDQELVAGQAR